MGSEMCIRDSNKTDYVAHLCETIREIIGGRQARDIPFYYGPKGTPVFNYQSLLQRNLDPELCPPGTVFYNMPPTFWEKYKYILIGIGFLLVGVLLIFQYHRLRVLEKIKMIQRRELQANERYLDLIDNMPILYMHEELIKDAEGKVVDTRYLDINRYFENNFFKREEIIGKLGSEVFPESMP